MGDVIRMAQANSGITEPGAVLVPILEKYLVDDKGYTGNLAGEYDIRNISEIRDEAGKLIALSLPIREHGEEITSRLRVYLKKDMMPDARPEMEFTLQNGTIVCIEIVEATGDTEQIEPDGSGGSVKGKERRVKSLENNVKDLKIKDAKELIDSGRSDIEDLTEAMLKTKLSAFLLDREDIDTGSELAGYTDAIRERNVLVSVSDGKVIGFIKFSSSDNRILYFVVSRGYQNRGVGKALMFSAIEELFKNNGHQGFVLGIDSTVRSKRTYENYFLEGFDEFDTSWDVTNLTSEGLSLHVDIVVKDPLPPAVDHGEILAPEPYEVLAEKHEDISGIVPAENNIKSLREKVLRAGLICVGIVAGLFAVELIVSFTTGGFSLWQNYLSFQSEPGIHSTIASAFTALFLGVGARLMGMYLSDTKTRRSIPIITIIFILQAIWRPVVGVATDMYFWLIEKNIDLPVFRALISLSCGIFISAVFDLFEPLFLARLDARRYERVGEKDKAEELRREVSFRKQWGRVKTGVMIRIVSSYFQHDITQNFASKEYRVLLLFSMGFFNNTFRSAIAFMRNTVVSPGKVFVWGVLFASFSAVIINPLNGIAGFSLAVLSWMYFRYSRKGQRAEGQEARDEKRKDDPTSGFTCDRIIFLVGIFALAFIAGFTACCMPELFAFREFLMPELSGIVENLRHFFVSIGASGSLPKGAGIAGVMVFITAFLAQRYAGADAEDEGQMVKGAGYEPESPGDKVHSRMEADMHPSVIEAVTLDSYEIGTLELMRKQDVTSYFRGLSEDEINVAEAVLSGKSEEHLFMIFSFDWRTVLKSLMIKVGAEDLSDLARVYEKYNILREKSRGRDEAIRAKKRRDGKKREIPKIKGEWRAQYTDGERVRGIVAKVAPDLITSDFKISLRVHQSLTNVQYKQINSLLSSEVKKGNAAARNIMIELNMGLVKKRVAHFLWKYPDLAGYEDDLISYGAYGFHEATKYKTSPSGLARAVELYGEGSAAFSTYAVFHIDAVIRRAIKHYFKERPDHQISLDDPMGSDDDARTKGDVMPSDEDQRPDNIAEEVIRREELVDRIRNTAMGLGIRERDLDIFLRVVMNGDTLREVGGDLNISHERVRQITAKTTYMLRRAVRDGVFSSDPALATAIESSGFAGDSSPERERSIPSGSGQAEDLTTPLEGKAAETDKGDNRGFPEVAMREVSEDEQNKYIPDLENIKALFQEFNDKLNKGDLDGAEMVLRNAERKIEELSDLPGNDYRVSKFFGKLSRDFGRLGNEILKNPDASKYSRRIEGILSSQHVTFLRVKESDRVPPGWLYIVSLYGKVGRFFIEMGTPQSIEKGSIFVERSHALFKENILAEGVLQKASYQIGNFCRLAGAYRRSSQTENAEKALERAVSVFEKYKDRQEAREGLVFQVKFIVRGLVMLADVLVRKNKTDQDLSRAENLLDMAAGIMKYDTAGSEREGFFFDVAVLYMRLVSLRRKDPTEIMSSINKFKEKLDKETDDAVSLAVFSFICLLLGKFAEAGLYAEASAHADGGILVKLGDQLKFSAGLAEKIRGSKTKEDLESRKDELENKEGITDMLGELLLSAIQDKTESFAAEPGTSIVLGKQGGEGKDDPVLSKMAPVTETLPKDAEKKEQCGLEDTGTTRKEETVSKKEQRSSPQKTRTTIDDRIRELEQAMSSDRVHEVVRLRQLLVAKREKAQKKGNITPALTNVLEKAETYLGKIGAEKDGSEEKKGYYFAAIPPIPFIAGGTVGMTLGEGIFIFIFIWLCLSFQKKAIVEFLQSKSGLGKWYSPVARLVEVFTRYALLDMSFLKWVKGKGDAVKDVRDKGEEQTAGQHEQVAENDGEMREDIVFADPIRERGIEINDIHGDVEKGTVDFENIREKLTRRDADEIISLFELEESGVFFVEGRGDSGKAYTFSRDADRNSCYVYHADDIRLFVFSDKTIPSRKYFIVHRKDISRFIGYGIYTDWGSDAEFRFQIFEKFRGDGWGDTVLDVIIQAIEGENPFLETITFYDAHRIESIEPLEKILTRRGFVKVHHDYVLIRNIMSQGSLEEGRGKKTDGEGQRSEDKEYRGNRFVSMSSAFLARLLRIVKENLRIFRIRRRHFPVAVSEDIMSIFDLAFSQGRSFLYEHEVYQVFDCVGIARPEYIFIPFDDSDGLSEVVKEKLFSALELNSEKVMIKIVADNITHKSRHKAGSGVRVADKHIDNLMREYRELKKVFSDPDLGSKGILICEKIDFVENKEFFIGINFDEQFERHVLAFGTGGVGVEQEKDTAYRVIPERRWDMLRFKGQLRKMISRTKIGERLDRKRRADLAGALEAVKRIVDSSGRYTVRELDMNPAVINEESGTITALDGVLKFSEAKEDKDPLSEQRDLATLLKPEKVVVFGGGLTAKKVMEQLSGNEVGIKIQMLSSSAELPASVDLAVICSGRDKVIPIIRRIVDQKSREEKKDISVIVIAGGFGESETGKKLDLELDKIIRESGQKGVKLNILGPNTLGIWTGKSGYSALFVDVDIPSHDGADSCVISQSGGYIVTRIGLGDRDWGMVISVGNAKDLGVADLLDAVLELRPDIEYIDIYIEGLRPGEGRSLCRSCRQAVEKDKRVRIYLTENNSAAKRSAASHTAAMLPQRKIAVDLLESEGVEIAPRRIDHPLDYEDLSRRIHELWPALADDPIKSIGMVTHTGMEAVTVCEAEEAGVLLKDFSEHSKKKLASVAGVPEIGTIQNPLDITGAGNEKIFLESAKIILESEEIDALIISVVMHLDDEVEKGSFINKLIELIKGSDKPVILSVPVSRNACSAVFDHLDNNNIIYVTYAAQAARLLAKNSVYSPNSLLKGKVFDDSDPNFSGESDTVQDKENTYGTGEGQRVEGERQGAEVEEQRAESEEQWVESGEGNVDEKREGQAMVTRDHSGGIIVDIPESSSIIDDMLMQVVFETKVYLRKIYPGIPDYHELCGPALDQFHMRARKLFGDKMDIIMHQSEIIFDSPYPHVFAVCYYRPLGLRYLVDISLPQFFKTAGTSEGFHAVGEYLKGSGNEFVQKLLSDGYVRVSDHDLKVYAEAFSKEETSDIDRLLMQLGSATRDTPVRAYRPEDRDHRDEPSAEPPSYSTGNFVSMPGNMGFSPGDDDIGQRFLSMPGFGDSTGSMAPTSSSFGDLKAVDTAPFGQNELKKAKEGADKGHKEVSDTSSHVPEIPDKKIPLPEREAVHARNFISVLEYINDKETERVSMVRDRMRRREDIGPGEDEFRHSIVAIGKSWLEGYPEGSDQFRALNPLLTHIRSYCRRRNIPFIVADDDDLPALIAREKQQRKMSPDTKVIILAGSDREKLFSENISGLLQNDSYTILGIDGRHLPANNYHRVMELLHMALVLSIGGAPVYDRSRIEILPPDGKRNFYIVVPRAQPIEYYEDLIALYAVQISA